MDFWKKSGNSTVKVEKANQKRQKPGWMIGVTIGVCFLVIGFFNEQFTDIYRKAIMICLECIGIG